MNVILYISKTGQKANSKRCIFPSTIRAVRSYQTSILHPTRDQKHCLLRVVLAIVSKHVFLHCQLSIVGLRLRFSTLQQNCNLISGPPPEPIIWYLPTLNLTREGLNLYVLDHIVRDFQQHGDRAYAFDTKPKLSAA